MNTCKQCGGEATNQFSPDCCIPCLEATMDALTTEDLATVINAMTSREVADEGSVDAEKQS
jgi:hypothetical protein